ncbi:hypothetical protein IWGMT90018_37580 [Mycobacterium kiyosense]|nr:hypothetical protein IWGMT90018_37580 [Mycobacterium kiyosense]
MRAVIDEAVKVAEREQLTYHGFLAELLLAECDDRDRRSTLRRVAAAGFPRQKWLGDFDFDANPNINAATVHTVAQGDWIRRGDPLCLIGDSGTGKSHLLIGVGTAAAEQGFRVRYTLATKLVNELVEAADEKQLARTIARYGRVDLLCIDELGYMELDRRGAGCCSKYSLNARKGVSSHRIQREFLRLDQNLHRPPTLRRDRRPTHLPRHHHRNRHHLIPAQPYPR